MGKDGVPEGGARPQGAQDIPGKQGGMTPPAIMDRHQYLVRLLLMLHK